MITRCELCPRRCGANREGGERGWCKAGENPQIFRYAPHHGEEPPVSGRHGSGTIFFSRCTLACLYCQNYPWSQQGEGDVYDEGGLANAFRALARQGCHNWNLVSPTPWMPAVHTALEQVRREGLRLPVVYNTSGYERIETLRAYADDIQIYLTDLRYSRASTALEGSKAADYVACARESLCEMWDRLGPLQLENDIALSGVICRILVLPGFAEEAVESLEWIAKELGTHVAVSVMAQYHPAWRAVDREPWNRPVTAEEYSRVCGVVESLGFETGWMQEPGAPQEDGLLGHTMSRGGFKGDCPL